MTEKIPEYLRRLSKTEKAQLERLAKQAGMTVAEWVEYSQKSQIYHNSLQVLTGEEAA